MQEIVTYLNKKSIPFLALNVVPLFTVYKFTIFCIFVSNKNSMVGIHYCYYNNEDSKLS